MSIGALAKKRMLIVDDDQNLTQSLYRSLRKKFDIQVALRGDIAIEAVRNCRPFDVILCDWMMPGLDGLAFMERARFMSPYAISILMTGSVANPFEEKPEASLFFGRLLKKPCSASDIWHSVCELEEKKERLWR